MVQIVLYIENFKIKIRSKFYLMMYENAGQVQVQSILILRYTPDLVKDNQGHRVASHLKNKKQKTFWVREGIL